LEPEAACVDNWHILVPGNDVCHSALYDAQSPVPYRVKPCLIWFQRAKI